MKADLEWTGYGPCDNKEIYRELSMLKKVKTSHFTFHIADIVQKCLEEKNILKPLNINISYNRNLLLAAIDFFSHNNPSIFKMFSDSEHSVFIELLESLKDNTKEWEVPEHRLHVIETVIRDFKRALEINL